MANLDGSPILAYACHDDVHVHVRATISYDYICLVGRAHSFENTKCTFAEFSRRNCGATPHGRPWGARMQRPGPAAAAGA
jgi:hypothetical protein